MNKVIYKHDCSSKANYHIGKYTHWSKKLEGIDYDKKKDFCIIGDFLNRTGENLVEKGTKIVECCGSSYTVYLIEGDNKKKELLKGTRSEHITFLRKCEEIINENNSFKA